MTWQHFAPTEVSRGASSHRVAWLASAGLCFWSSCHGGSTVRRGHRGDGRLEKLPVPPRPEPGGCSTRPSRVPLGTLLVAPGLPRLHCWAASPVQDVPEQGFRWGQCQEVPGRLGFTVHPTLSGGGVRCFAACLGAGAPPGAMLSGPQAAGLRAPRWGADRSPALGRSGEPQDPAQGMSAVGVSAAPQAICSYFFFSVVNENTENYTKPMFEDE